ncbi:ribosomal protection-like ABC-F family protein [Leptolyngbya sp. AN02str]|uniref:ribosomal protection-like ABC-F family protein n=1 Tax=Leptolyngbya sp. AN02str TaxID=3423363 RepID=UPI003D31C6B2
MLHDRHPCLIAENLSYQVSSTRLLFQNIHLSVSPGDQIALVGSNGVGKSTLLKILAGEIQPKQGTVSRMGLTYYLPQISTIQESIQSNSIFTFLNAISNEWWEIEQMLETTFGMTLDVSLPMQSLSGGELSKLMLAIGLVRSPDLLLLDEPTNHLDYLAVEELRQFLCQFHGAFIVVSHKPLFLDQVTRTTWELTPHGLQTYGGNYSFYQEQKQLEQAARVRSHETARKELKRAKLSALREQERAAQSSRNGRSRQLNGDMPRILAGGLKRQAEVTAATLKVKHDRAIAAATQKVTETKVKTTKATRVHLEENHQKPQNLIDIDHASLWVDHRLLLKDIQLHVQSGDRISIVGANGAGKSSFVQSMLGIGSASARLQGSARLAQMQVVYLDQQYALVDRTQTVLENIQRANSAIDYQLLRQQLGHFLFFGNDVHKLASTLSGGELARLAIAMITISELDLLILDEPTNNLDIETVDQIVEALDEFHGALLVISHDLDFVSRIHINRSYRVKHQTLQQTVFLPSERSQYYHELLDTRG